MRWLAFFGATVFAVTASGQCIEGVPAAYPLGEQVALHVLDPDCSFEAKWKKHLADPSVDSVGLIYHERISVPAMELMKSNPSSGQTLAVWGLDGESSTKATTTTATDIGGDYSAYVLTVQAPSCNSARIGSIVTTPDKTEVAGFVRKVIEGPQCTLHVIKPSSIRSLLSVQVPVGAPVDKLNGVASRYVPLKIAEPREPAADVVTRNASTDSHREPRDGAVPLVLVLKKEKLSGWLNCHVHPDGIYLIEPVAGSITCMEMLGRKIIELWREKEPPLSLRMLTPVIVSDDKQWMNTSRPVDVKRQVVILFHTGWTVGFLTVGVQNESAGGCISSKFPVKLGQTVDRNVDLLATAIVDYLAQSPCLQTGAAGAKR